LTAAGADEEEEDVEACAGATSRREESADFRSVECFSAGFSVAERVFSDKERRAEDVGAVPAAEVEVDDGVAEAEAVDGTLLTGVERDADEAVVGRRSRVGFTSLSFVGSATTRSRGRTGPPTEEDCEEVDCVRERADDGRFSEFDNPAWDS
jgi:hypothetical protein